MDSFSSGQVWGDELPRRLTTEKSEAVYELATVAMEKPWKLSDFAFFLAHPAAYSFGINDPSGLLSSCLVGLLADGELDIITFMTHPALRRKGLAKRLMQWLCEDSKIYRITLEVDVENIPAFYLYKNLGFEIDSLRRKYYDNKRDAYLMSLIVTRKK
jgi:ribosomal protein S18 acetylase RimI-like enzyme